MKNRTLLLLCFLIFVKISFAQVDLKVESHYLLNKNLLKAHVHKSGELWCLGIDSTSVYRMDSNGTVHDETQKIQDIIGDKITCLLCLSEGSVLLGTKTKSLWSYKNGQFKKFSTNEGIMTSCITSIVSKNNFFDGRQIFKIGTDEGYYTSEDGLTFKKINSSGIYTFYDYNFFKKNISGRIEYVTETLVASYSQYFNALPDSVKECNEIRYLNTYQYFGFVTDKGYYTGATYGIKSIIPNIHSYTLVKYEGVALIGTEEGLFVDPFNDKPYKSDLGDNYVVRQIHIDKGCLWLVTNKGLLRVINANCAYFNVDYSASRMLVNLADSSDVIFSPTDNSVFDQLLWDFGDGNNSQKTEPVYDFTKLGYQNVKLTASNGTCTDAINKSLLVINEPLLNDVEFSIKDLDFFSDNASSVNVVDFDNDGDLDIFLGKYSVNISSCIPELYSNDGHGNFTLHTSFSDINILSASVWGDIDNDRYQELIYANFNGIIVYNIQERVTDTIYRENAFYVNTIVTSDINNDGWLDLVITNTNSSNLILLNNGKGKFIQLNDSVFSKGENSNFAFCVDIDDDNDQDIMTLNKIRNHLYVNDGNGLFTEDLSNVICQSDDIGYSNKNVSMSWGDFNNDGKNDVVTANEESIRLFENKGNLEFNSYNKFFGNLAAQWYTNTNWFDVENDGDIDLMVLSERLEHFLYYNTVEHGFYRNAFLKGKYQGLYIQASVPADFNGDGLSDIVFVTNERSNKILINESPNINNYLKVAFFPFKSNYSAIGAKVYVYTNGGEKIQMKEVVGVSSIRSQMPNILNFGVGKVQSIDSIVVKWPSKQKTLLKNIDVNQLITVIEQPYFNDIDLCNGSTQVINMPENKSIIYKWYKDGNLIDTENNSSIVINSGGKYKLEVNQYGTIVSSNDFNVLLREKPEVLIEGSEYIEKCVGQKITLAASGSNDYVWYKNGRYINENNAKINIDSAGLYSVVGTNQWFCQDTSNIIQVIDLATPSFSLGEDKTVCGDEIVSLNAGSINNQYLWNDGSTDYTLNVSKEGKYWLRQTNSVGCSFTDTINIKYDLRMNLNIPTDTTVCGYLEITLPVGEGVEYYLNSYKHLGNKIYINYPGVNKIAIKNENCSIEKTTNVKINRLPYFSLGKDTTISYQKSLTLYAPKGFKSYLWNDGSELDYLFIDGKDYNIGYNNISLKVENNEGCTFEDQIDVLININTGIDGLDKGLIKIYPIPTSNFINLSIPASIIGYDKISYQIYSIDGKMISSEISFKCQNYQINVADLNPGVYFLILRIGDDIISNKFIIER